MKNRLDDYDPLLKIADDWAIGKMVARIDNEYPPWIAVHLCGIRSHGWYLLRGDKCSRCAMVFPDAIIGMRNMLNGLE